MGGTYSRIKTFIHGETILAAEANAEHNNHINNNDPDGCGDASADLAEMKNTTDPYPAENESLATDLRGELERLRYGIQQITLKPEWYQPPRLVTKTADYTVSIKDDEVLCDATSNVITLTLPTAVSIGRKEFYLVKTDNTAYAVTIDGSTSETINGELTHVLKFQYDSVRIVSDGANWIIVNEVRKHIERPHTCNNLVVSGNATDDVTITADEITLEDANGRIYLAKSVSEALVMDGDADLDTGAEATSTNYAIWLFYNPVTDDIEGKYSESFTAPTASTGYTFKRLISFVYNDSSDDFVPFTQYNSDYRYDIDVNIGGMVTIVGSTFIDADLSPYIGDDILVRKALIYLVMECTTSGNGHIIVRANGDAGAGISIQYILSATAADTFQQSVVEVPLADGVCEFKETGGNMTQVAVYIRGCKIRTL